VKKAFIATAVVIDDEMRQRIEKHQSERKNEFDTFEESKKLASLLDKIASKYDVILIDCIPFLINNLMYAGKTDEEILKEFELSLNNLEKSNAKVILVTNEVGFGIVPDNDAARRFRDLLGRVNQMLAEKSCCVYLMVSGIPLKLKHLEVSWNLYKIW
jgi:adenosylcobinamide kinase/adenosylcobinamide-phosphate guanylyltransferase